MVKLYEDQYEALLLKISLLKEAHLTGSGAVIHIIIDYTISLQSRRGRETPPQKTKQNHTAPRSTSLTVSLNARSDGCVSSLAAHESLSVTETRRHAANLLVKSDSSNPEPLLVGGEPHCYHMTLEERRRGGADRWDGRTAAHRVFVRKRERSRIFQH